MRLTAALLLLVTTFARAGQVTPAVGMVFDQSCTVTPGTYVLKSPGADQAAIVIRGDDLVIDFSGAVLVGNEDATRPDLFTGRAIEVKGRNVTIKGLVARGYRIAVYGSECQNLSLLDCDLSYNFRPRLKSTPWREDLDDWMSFHHNESDEWLAFGSAVYLKKCDQFLIRNLTVTGGQNGVLLNGCNGGIIHSSLISFNSGIGIGLYRSSGNRFSANRLDYNVRGHSEGIYNRGQDSAAFLVYEQSSNNVFDRNSATHSGDGFFLWAGQSTMDTGAGGCNDNLIAQNDFSFAATNGIEVTFSRNAIIGNTLRGCWHGIWGGYSYDSVIADNDFADNVEAINIEHGQNNLIDGNRFKGDLLGVHLYERGTPPDWGYGKSRDTHSHGYRIADNRFADMPVAIRVLATSGVGGSDNQFQNVQTPMDIDGIEFADQPNPTTRPIKVVIPEPVPSGKVPAPFVDLPRERRSIRMTEWGPHDYQSPLVWPDVGSDPTGRTLLLFDPAGKAGTWRIATEALRDIPIEPAGAGMHRMVLPAEDGKLADLSVSLQWTGDRLLIDSFGRPLPAGKPVELPYRHFHAPLRWNVQFFTWSGASDPRTAERVFQTDVVATRTVDRLDFHGSGAWAAGMPTDHFATRAQTSLDAPAGEYVLNLTSDDGVRVFLDDKQVFSDWTYHSPRTEAIPLRLDGRHSLRIEHFEIDGYAQLTAELGRKAHSAE